MAELVPALVGTHGLVAGECFILERGVEVVIGRSRSCDISLRRVPNYLKAAPATRDDDHDFNTVSRRHASVRVQGSTAEVRDTSTNGTSVNGEPVRDRATVDLATGTVQLRLGTRETFDFALLPPDDARVANRKPIAAAAAANDTRPSHHDHD